MIKPKVDLRLYIDFDKENKIVHYSGFSPPFCEKKIGYYRDCEKKSVRAVFLAELREDCLEQISQVAQRYETTIVENNSIEVVHTITDVSATFEYLFYDEMKTFYAEMVKLFLITT